MKENTNSSKNLIITAIFVIALGVAGYMYITRDTSGDDLLLVNPVTSAPVVNTDLLSALREFKKLTIKTDIFETPAWGSLVDFGKTLKEREKYRPNPFAPIGQTSSQSTSTSSQ